MAAKHLPIDILNKTFPRRLRGLDRSAVSTFLEEVAASMEEVMAQNSSLEKRIQLAEEELQRYKAMEKTLNEAFILAQKTAEEIHLNAKKEAALTLTQANQEREQILRSTKQEAASLQETIEELNRAKHHFLADLKGLLTSIWELAQNGRGPRSIPSLPLEEPTQPNEQEGLPVSPFIST